jgi:hypothetical protein
MLYTEKESYNAANITFMGILQGDSLARGLKHFEKSIPEFGETH